MGSISNFFSSNFSRQKGGKLKFGQPQNMYLSQYRKKDISILINKISDGQRIY